MLLSSFLGNENNEIQMRESISYQISRISVKMCMEYMRKSIYDPVHTKLHYDSKWLKIRTARQHLENVFHIEFEHKICEPVYGLMAILVENQNRATTFKVFRIKFHIRRSISLCKEYLKMTNQTQVTNSTQF
jgi:hypothetical protein